MGFYMGFIWVCDMLKLPKFAVESCKFCVICKLMKFIYFFLHSFKTLSQIITITYR